MKAGEKGMRVVEKGEVRTRIGMGERGQECMSGGGGWERRGMGGEAGCQEISSQLMSLWFWLRRFFQMMSL